MNFSFGILVLMLVGGFLLLMVLGVPIAFSLAIAALFTAAVTCAVAIRLLAFFRDPRSSSQPSYSKNSSASIHPRHIAVKKTKQIVIFWAIFIRMFSADRQILFLQVFVNRDHTIQNHLIRDHKS